MEDWQTDHINTNLPKLIKTTKCTTMLRAGLRAKGLISEEEDEGMLVLGKNEGSIPEAMQLYTILMTRRNSYAGLLEELEANRQSGALQILQDGLHKHATSPLNLEYQIDLLLDISVTLFGVTKPVKDLFPDFTRIEAANMLQTSKVKEEIFALHDKKQHLNLDAILPTPRELYIPRMISNRIMLDSNIFRDRCPDVFVFKGIPRATLARLVSPNVTRSSTSQRSCITSRHIYLDNDEDWHDLVLVSESPIHLVHMEDYCYFLLRSTEVTEAIMKRSYNTHRHRSSYVSEDELIERLVLNKSAKGALLCDIPGMGKTWLMESLARKFRNFAREALVYFIELSTFGKNLGKLQKSPAKEDGLQYILEHVYGCKLAALAMLHHLKRNPLQIVILLDGFDEIEYNFVNRTTIFLRNLVSIDNIWLVISSRPSMRNHLEQTFNVISYDILPFDRQEQVQAIASQWYTKYPQCDMKTLTDYATQCIESIKHIKQPEGHDILGVPLKCFILAVINEKYVQQQLASTTTKSLSINHIAAVKSICDLYKKFVEASFQKMTHTQSVVPTKDWKAAIERFHVYHSLLLLFPEVAPALSLTVKPVYERPSLEEVVRIGILCSNDGPSFTFVHRSFAEYFSGNFFANFWSEMDTFSPKTIQAVGKYFLESILGNVKEGDTTSIKKLHFSLYNLNELSNQTFSVTFTWTTVLWFMNSVRRSALNIDYQFLTLKRFKCILRSGKPDLADVNHVKACKNIIKRGICGVLLACNCEGLGKILSLFVQIVKVFFKEQQICKIIRTCWKLGKDAMPILLYCMSRGGQPETVDEIFRLFDGVKKNHLLEFCKTFPEEFLSPLEVAIVKNDMDMFVYFSDKLHVSKDRLIVGCCFPNSPPGFRMTDEDIKMRSSIFNCIIDPTEEGKGSVTMAALGDYLKTAEDFSWNWVGFMIKHNLITHDLTRSDKLAFLKEGISSKHPMRVNVDMEHITGVEIILELIVFLFSKIDDGGNVGKESDEYGNSTAGICKLPANQIHPKLDLEDGHETFLALRALENCLGTASREILLSNVESLETLQVLIAICEDFALCNLEKFSYIHQATKLARVDWLEFLINAGHDINQKDTYGNTPLHFVTDREMMRITILLVENGVDVNAVNSFKENAAHKIVQQRGTEDELKDWILYIQKQGHHELWNMPDRNESTPLGLLSARVGFTHPATRLVLSYMTNGSQISIQVKRKLLENTIIHGSDKDAMDLLLFLFGTNGCIPTVPNEETHLATSANCLEKGSLTADNIITALDIEDGRNVFLGISFDSKYAFENFESLETLKLFHCMCTDITECIIWKRNYLHIAAHKGEVEWIEYLLESDHNVNQRDKEGNTPLLCISSDQPLELTQLLIEKGADILAVNDRKQNVAHRLITRFDPKEYYEEVLYEWVSFIVKNGYSELLNSIDDIGETPFQCIQTEELKRQLIYRTVGIIKTDPLITKKELLEDALCHQTDEEILRLLTALFPNTDETNRASTATTEIPINAFNISSEEDHFEVSEALQAIDVDKAFETFHELEVNTNETFRNMRKTSTLKVLTSICPDFGQCNRHQLNYLHIAVSNGNIDWIHHLLKSGFDVNEVSALGTTPLMHLSRTSRIEVTKLLLETGSDCYAVNRLRENVLHILLKCKASEVETLSDWITFILDNRYNLLWEMKDERKRITPFQLLVSLVGENHTITQNVLSSFNKFEKRYIYNAVEQKLSIQHKRAIIEMALAKMDDEELLFLILNMFRKDSIERTQLYSKFEYMNFNLTKGSNFVNQLDLDAAKIVLAEVDLDLPDVIFRKIYKLRTLQILSAIWPDLNECYYAPFNYIHLAVIYQRVGWIQYLMKNGHDVNQATRGSGWKPIHLVNITLTRPQENVPTSLEVTNLLIDAGVDVYAVDEFKRNVLHNTFFMFDLAGVEAVYNWTICMLQQGHRKLWDMMDEDGNTPFALLQNVVWQNMGDKPPTKPHFLLFLLSEDFNLNSHKLLRRKNLSTEQVISVIFRHNICIKKLKGEQKAVLLREAIYEGTDAEIIQLLLLLFPKLNTDNSGNQANGPYSKDSNVDDVYHLIDASEAEMTFWQLGLDVFRVFRNIHNIETLQLFERICCNFSFTNDCEANYFHIAAIQGRVRWYQHLIDGGYDANQSDNNGNRPLHLINLDVATKLLPHLISCGGDVEVINNLNMTVLHKLLSQCNPNKVDDVVELVIYMLKCHSISIWTMRDKCEKSRKTPIEILTTILGENHAATKAVNHQIHKCTRSSQLDVEIPMAMRRLLLDQAIKCYTDENFIEVLMKLFRKCNGTTCGHRETVANFNADAIMECLDQHAARQVFAELDIGSNIVFRNIWQLETLKILVAFWPGFRVSNSSARNFLHLAVQLGNVKWVELLIKLGYNVNEPDINGDTPLLSISFQNPTEITRRLIENGADLYATNEMKQNVAHKLIKLVEYNKESFCVLYEWISYTMRKRYHQIWNRTNNEGLSPLDILETHDFKITK